MMLLLEPHKSRSYRLDRMGFGVGAFGSFGAAGYQVVQLCSVQGSSSQSWWTMGALTATLMVSVFGLVRTEQHRRAEISSLDEMRLLNSSDNAAPEELAREVNLTYAALKLDRSDTPPTPGTETLHQKTLRQLSVIRAHCQRAWGDTSPRFSIQNDEPIEIP